ERSSHAKVKSQADGIATRRIVTLAAVRRALLPVGISDTVSLHSMLFNKLARAGCALRAGRRDRSQSASRSRLDVLNFEKCLVRRRMRATELPKSRQHGIYLAYEIFIVSLSRYSG